MIIRLARIDESEQIVSILNQTTLDLHQKGVNQWSYPWNEELIERDILNSQVYVLLQEGNPVGTFAVTDIEELSELSVHPNSKCLCRIAILPEFQGKKFGAKITSFAQALVKDLNTTLYLDCWAGNEKLKAFYIQNGFTYVGDYPEDAYFISIFQYN